MANPSVGALRVRLQRAGDFFATQRHLMAIRDGVVGALPLVLVGSLFLLVAQPPSRALQEIVAPYVPMLLVPYRMLGGLIALYVSFTTAHSLAKQYQLDPMATGLVSMAAYLVAAFPTPALAVPGVAAAPMVLPLARLGPAGIFAALLVAIATAEITKQLVKRNWTIRMHPGAPEIVIRSFVALIPTVTMVTLSFLIVHLAGIDLVTLLEQAARPLLKASGSFIAALLVVATDSALWLLGVHATAVLATLKPLWETMVIENSNAAIAGETVLPHIANGEFYRWWSWQGGSGMTLAVALLLLRARSGQLRAVGKVGFLPALCNINEPILFGIPIVLNPSFAIPFFLVPLVCTTTSYAAFYFNWVGRPFREIIWTIPSPVGAFLSTSDWRAVVLQMLNLGIAVLIYWPFVRRYDRRLLASPAADLSAAPSPQSR